MKNQSAQKPNIVFILCDQLARDALTIYGNTFGKTPHIDSLAERGVAFSRCYTNSPLCLPARAALWTGRFPHQTSIINNGKQRGRIPPKPISTEIPTLGQLFTDAGYTTKHFGKTHDGGSLRGFDCAPQNSVEVENQYPWPVSDDSFRDRGTREQAVDFLKDHGNKPYFAVVDFNNPHEICTYVGENQGREATLPDIGELPELPDNFRDLDFHLRPLPVQYLCCTHVRQSQAAHWSPEQYRHYLAAYHHYINRLDNEIGILLKALRSRSDFSDTYIVFCADHGDGMAAHGIVTKQVAFYEEITAVPLIICGPESKKQKRNQKTTTLTSLIDLFPTFCDIGGIVLPEKYWGHSLVEEIEIGSSSAKRHPYVIAEWDSEWDATREPGRMLVTEEYKYICYADRQGEALFNLKKDPKETVTLISSRQYKNVLDEHRTLLKTHLEESDDSFSELKVCLGTQTRSHSPGYHNHEGPAEPECVEFSANLKQ